MEQWTIPDDDNILLGPEQKVAQYVEDNSLIAIAIRDIFDKKVAQKVIRFFMYGFPEEYLTMVNNWLVIPKVGLQSSLNKLFMSATPDDTTKLVEEILEQHCYALTSSQRTADWFTLRTFHLTATMASKLLPDSITSTTTSVELMSSLIKSWFNRNRSTEPMVIGSKNEEAVLLHLASKNYVLNMYDCGLLESKDSPWLAASPDAIAVIDTGDGEAKHCVVEVKTRVSPEKIADALQIAKKHNNAVIFTDFESDVWKECVEQDHSNQIMVQLIVTGFVQGWK